MPDVYRVDMLPSAKKELLSLPNPMLRRLADAISGLSANPRPIGSRKLVGTECRYRVRVGDYRALYEIIEEPKIVRVYRVSHRKDAYK